LKLGSGFTLGAVDGLRVSELAERSGLAPSTVRFYERAGLLSPARRAANGYRVFDESALEELAFISRAKGIGMSLDDIADLVASWPIAARIQHAVRKRPEITSMNRAKQTQPRARTSTPRRAVCYRHVLSKPQFNGLILPLQELPGHHHALDLVGALVDLGDRGRTGSFPRSASCWSP